MQRTDRRPKSAVCTGRVARWAVLGLLVATGALGGCAVLPPTHYIGETTPYYYEGPLQTRPVDGFLDPGAKVWLIEKKKKNGFSRVWLTSGKAADVWTNSLTPADKWKPPQ